MEAASCRRELQRPDCISCMPVQLKINHPIVIVVTIVAARQVAAKFIGRPF